MMLYFKFDADFRNGACPCKKSFIEKIIIWILKRFVPRANPTLEAKIDEMKVWYIEYNESDECTNREVGIDGGRNVVFKAPWKGNFGYWCDNNLKLKNYKEFHLKKVTQEVFERLWDCELGKHIYLNDFKSVEEAIRVLKENAIAHGRCTESGDYKKGNVCYDTIIDAIHFINAANMSKLFEPLLSDANSSVRSWSAFALLHIDTKRAVKTLEEIAKQDKSLVAFSAETILAEFRKGSI